MRIVYGMMKTQSEYRPFVPEQSSAYWTIAPNYKRWVYHFPNLDDAPIDSQRLTITRDDRNWQKAKDFPCLVELTLHEPDQTQLAALIDFPRLTRLRINPNTPPSQNHLISCGVLLLKDISCTRCFIRSS